MRADVADRLRRIYPDLGPAAINKLVERVLEAAGVDGTSERASTVDPNDRFRSDEVVLITYGDTFSAATDQPHLGALARFWRDHLAHAFTTVHVLPFSPSSSDGGFAVVDYRQIAPELGGWSDLAELTSQADLMADLVCNHGSAQSEWFRQFLNDEAPGRDYFLTVDANDSEAMAALDYVTRPRTHPLLRPTDTASGLRQVWATFSHDQVDFDFSNPDVLVEFCEILGLYVSQGASRIRLDAIAYLWKELGTSCVHLPQTHQVVKLMRLLLEARDPHALLITETNVPHRDNVSYFGDGDEAHVVYNFTLAPLIAWSLVTANAEPLTNWMAKLVPPPPGCAFLNFIASHDGIGLRPVEDLISSTELQPLIDAAEAVGGSYSAYSAPGGPRPYELNVSLADLLAGPDGDTAQRFVLAHALMLAVQGIPAIYVHSMLVTPGDVAAAEASGHKRDINRPRIAVDDADLQIRTGWRAEVFVSLAELISLARSQPAFGPTGSQVVHVLHPNVVAIQRRAGDDQVFAIHNMSDQPVELTLPPVAGRHDLITNTMVDQQLALAPWQAVWLDESKSE